MPRGSKDCLHRQAEAAGASTSRRATRSKAFRSDRRGARLGDGQQGIRRRKEERLGPQVGLEEDGGTEERAEKIAGEAFREEGPVPRSQGCSEVLSQARREEVDVPRSQGRRQEVVLGRPQERGEENVVSGGRKTAAKKSS